MVAGDRYPSAADRPVASRFDVAISRGHARKLFPISPPPGTAEADNNRSSQPKQPDDGIGNTLVSSGVRTRPFLSGRNARVALRGAAVDWSVRGRLPLWTCKEVAAEGIPQP